MATVKSIQKTKWDVVPYTKMEPNEMGGRVRIAYAEYEAATLASGSVIEAFNPPCDGRILGGQLVTDALGASTTLSVGYAAFTDKDGNAVAADPDHFLAATDTSTAGAHDVASTLALGFGEIVDADGTGMPITMTLGGGDATGTIVLTMLYAVD